MAAVMRKVKAAVAVAGLLFLLAEFALVAEAVSCNPVQLLPCLNSFITPAPPSPLCCSKLKEQEPCLCGYIKNPAFAPYIKSPNAKTVMRVCHVTYPKC
ncbi:hypothetical protein QQ045_005445 [Rhodiola kirilowii]